MLEQMSMEQMLERDEKMREMLKPDYKKEIIKKVKKELSLEVKIKLLKRKKLQLRNKRNYIRWLVKN